MNTPNLPEAGTRECRRTGQYFPTINGRDISPTSFDQERALQIAKAAISSRVVSLTTEPTQYAKL